MNLIFVKKMNLNFFKKINIFLEKTKNLDENLKIKEF